MHTIISHKHAQELPCPDCNIESPASELAEVLPALRLKFTGSSPSCTDDDLLVLALGGPLER